MRLALQPFGRTPRCSPSPPFHSRFPLASPTPLFRCFFLPSHFWCPGAQSSAPTSSLLTAHHPTIHLDCLPAPLKLIPQKTPSSLELFPNQVLLEIRKGDWQKEQSRSCIKMSSLATTCKQQAARVHYALLQTPSISHSRMAKGWHLEPLWGRASPSDTLHCQLYRTSRVRELAYFPYHWRHLDKICYE